MRIVGNTDVEPRRPAFEQIPVGSAFVFDDEFYLKVRYEASFYAVNLKTGELRMLSPLASVILREAEVNLL